MPDPAAAIDPSAIQEIAELIKPLAKETWLLKPARNGVGTGLDVPLLGGTPYAEAGEAWPLDPASGEPMTFVLQFMAGKILHVVFVQGMTLVETDLHLVDGRGGIVVRRHAKASANRCAALRAPKGVRRGPVRARIERLPCFPDWQEKAVRAIREHCGAIYPDAPWEVYERAAVKLGARKFDINGAKLFGYQSALQGKIEFDCPDCRRPMEFLAQAAVDVDGVQILYLLRCPRHRSRIAGVAQYT
jgi:hypothetical protein